MRGKQRPPEERVSSVAGPLPPCRVCGEQAAGFHYGANTCEACKGFFRRSLLRNGKYECIGDGNCVISTNRRKSCPKCRYLKCLSVGMSKEAIKTGRYTYTKRTQDTLELKMLERTKKQGVSDFDIKSDTEAETLAEMTPPSIEPGLHDDIKEGINLGTGTLSKLPSITVELYNTSACTPLSPSVLSSSQPLTEFKSTLSTELLTLSPCDSQKDTGKVERIEEFKSRGVSGDNSLHCDLKNVIHSLVMPDSKVFSPLNSTLLSPLSMAESCEFSPASQKVSHWDPRCSKMFPSSLETSPALSCSPLPSPMPSMQSQQRHNEAASKGWHVYSETELDGFISDIVENHKIYVEDSNSITDDVLQQMYKECKERCSLQTEIFGHMGTIKRDEHDQIYNSTGLDVDGRLDDISYAAEKMDIYIRQMITFMKLIPGFRSLTLPDQTALVKASIYDIFLLGYFRGYNKQDYIVVELARSYCKHQMEIFQSQEDLDKVFHISQKLQNLHLTFEMIIILKALCVFSSDRASLEEPDNIERLQFKLVQSLLLLLKRHFSDQNSLMFGKIISVLTQSRNYAEDCRKFIMTNMFTGSYMERFHSVPVLVELFSANL